MADANRLKRPEVIEAAINGHVSGIAKHLGLKCKEDKQMTKERDIKVVSPWAEAVWKDMTDKKYFDGTRLALRSHVKKWQLCLVEL